MSAPIGSSTTRSASARSASVAAQTRLVGGQSGVASAAPARGQASGQALGQTLGQESGSRPQVQSRRVSLKLGPLGITYSTDQVLWPEAAATAGAGAAVADASPSPGLDPDAEPVDAVSGLPGSGQNSGQASQSNQAEHAQQAGAAAAGRSFHQELAQAWRRQIEARTAETYGPDGAPRSGLSSAATTAANSAEAGSSAPAATAAATGAASSAGASAATPSAENTTAPPAARMRRAIGAYLACARDFSSAQPMLTAVA